MNCMPKELQISDFKFTVILFEAYKAKLCPDTTVCWYFLTVNPLDKWFNWHMLHYARAFFIKGLYASRHFSDQFLNLFEKSH